MDSITGRASVRYVSDEPGAISLPGFLNPNPGIVEPGDVFTVDPSVVKELSRSPRFEILGDDYEPPSGNESLSKAELGDKLGLDEAEVKKLSKADLVALADEHDAANPEPPVDPDGENNEQNGQNR